MDGLKITGPIKVVLAFILLACIALPFSSCSHQIDEDGNFTYLSHKPSVKTVTEYNYLWKSKYAPDYEGLLLLLCFLWPVPIMVHRRRSSGKKLKFIFWVSEPLLAAASAYYIWESANILTRPEIGAYLAVGANSAYAAVWLWEAVLRVRIKGERIKD